jgi:hypothetical protein
MPTIEEITSAVCLEFSTMSDQQFWAYGFAAAFLFLALVLA